jgi:hypothetical protein
MPLMSRARLALLLLLFAVCPPATAQVAKVMSIEGTAMLERAGYSPRIVGAGEGIEQKDVISVPLRSHALLEFRDKTRITLRPNTVFRVDTFVDTVQPSMVLGLIKGGLRVVTGDIAKRQPTAVRFQTNTAIIGVRGTEFDARLCDADCAQENRAQPVARSGREAAARVIEMNGSVTATQKGTSRALVPGAAIYVDDAVGAGADSYAVIGFRDGTRITLAARSELAIPHFEYDPTNPKKGEARLKLVSGTAHVWTGQLAKQGGAAFLFETRAGVIRPQGTGFTVGGDEVMVIHTWDGGVIVQTATERVVLKKGDSVAIAIVDGKITVLDSPPAFLLDDKLPRPDRVAGDPATSGDAAPAEPGLYIWVHEGAVVLDKDQKTVQVPAGQAALATRERLALLDLVPNFMRSDATPRPNAAGGPAGLLLPFFRRPDGSVVGMCRP